MVPVCGRELSWLDFNTRVLGEAERTDSPPLERLRFLAITASNLDEFYMVRVAYLHDRRGEEAPDDCGLTPRRQLELVLERARHFQRRQDRCLAQLRRALEGEDIRFLSPRELDKEQRAFTEVLFREEILPVLTPMAVDRGRPFPFLSGRSLGIAVRMRGDEGQAIFAVVQVPGNLPRFIRLPSRTGVRLLPLETLMVSHLGELFDRYPIQASGLFRLTRSADFDAADDADDLLEEMRRTIRQRKRGRPIRLELAAGFDRDLRRFLETSLRVGKGYVIEVHGLLDLAALGRAAFVQECRHLLAPPIEPVPAADFADAGGDVFAAVRARDRMVHHPYESFDHVGRFLEQAACDTGVLAIKMTLYRVSGRSRVISALEAAAEAGKQVTVLVELKARFDEENNIRWAKRLERAGCHVIYGLHGLKTHCKMILVVRREAAGLRRYLHLGTGNYNDVTARAYSDIGLFTARESLGTDASALFNRLTGHMRPPGYSQLLVAPEGMKRELLRMILGEAAHARAGRASGISIKVNALLDTAVIGALYEASRAGVPVRLVVRGICTLLPGVPGMSETVRVRSIVGQVLEHSRVFVFQNGGDPRYFLGSADLMPRNLDRRVEVLFPVEEPLLRERLDELLELLWRDNTGAWEFHRDGVYRRVPREGRPVCAQRELGVRAMRRLWASRTRDKEDMEE